MHGETMKSATNIQSGSKNNLSQKPTTEYWPGTILTLTSYMM